MRPVAAFVLAIAVSGSAAVLAALPQGNAERPTASSRFIRDAAQFRARQDQLVNGLRQQSPQAAAALEQVFSQDVLALLAPEMRRMGLNDQDAADMTAIYWIAAWEASHGIVGRKTDPAVVKAARNQIAGILASNPATRQLDDRAKQEIADTMLLQTILLEARMDAAAKSGPAMQKQVSDAIHGEASALLKTDLRQLNLTAAGFAGAGGSVPAGSSPAVPVRAVAPAAPATTRATARPAAHAANWAKVEGVYFKSFGSFGAGGMAGLDFEPLVLFKDGSYYEVEGDALEDIDLAERRRSKPGKWGRWARNAAGFTLTTPQGRTVDAKLQGGSIFKAFPGEISGNRLAARYSRLSGGGNAAFGGDLSIASQNVLTFTSEGRYMRAANAGAASGGGGTGVGVTTSVRDTSAVGTYRIERFSILLSEPGGHVRRQFFAFGSKKTPPQPDLGLIFVGDRVFIERSK